MTKEEIKGMSPDEKRALLAEANAVYRNSGELLLTDQQYDELERELGLENRNDVGAPNTGKYVIRHAFVMGSLAKTHILEKEDGSINYPEAAQEVTRAIAKASGPRTVEVTPKLDGCSFSAEFRNVGGKAELVSCSTRGDSEYGADMSMFFRHALGKWFPKIDDAVAGICGEGDILSIRGEILIDIPTFESYEGKKVNPRSMVSGIIGTDWNGDPDFLAKVRDLHWVCYDYRLVHEGGAYTELSWMNPTDPTYGVLEPYLGGIGELPDADFCRVVEFGGGVSADTLRSIYEDFDRYRNNTSKYALDGIVFKPATSSRLYEPQRLRPADAIAVKFLPMKADTEVIGIEWTTGKTNEYSATAIIRTARLDGKSVNRAKVGSYKIMKTDGIGVGAKVTVALSGDIIPDIVKVTGPVEFSNANMMIPDDAYEETHQNSGTPHLYRKLTGDDLTRHMFLASAEALDIPSIGPAARSDIWDAMRGEVESLDNIIKLMDDARLARMEALMGGGKTVRTYADNIRAYRKTMTLQQLIMSFCFPSCGKTASDICARIISGLPYTKSGSSLGYAWALTEGSREMYLVREAMDALGIGEMEDDGAAEQIPVILTGEPTNGMSKSKWLAAHPEYRMTTKWAECRILFTNDMTSTTGKMQKAAEINAKGKQHIDVKTYDEADASGGQRRTAGVAKEPAKQEPQQTGLW